MRRYLLAILVVCLVARASSDYVEDYHRSVEIECRNHVSNLSDIVYFHNRCKDYNTTVRLERSPIHKGFGLMAARKLKQGELILSELPALVFTSELYDRLDRDQFERHILENSLIYMPEAELAEFLTLADAWSPESPRIYNIITSNMFNLNDHMAVFVKISRINHSCKPNSYYNFYDGTMNVFAAREIEPNEELTISYLDDFQTKEERQKHLRDNYGFECHCELCSRNTSDSREAEREANRAKLGEMFDTDRSEESPEDNIRYYEFMWDLAKKEGLENDTVIMGEITVNLLDNLLKIPDYQKRYNYNPNQLAVSAFGNLSVPYGRNSVLREYPIFTQTFSYLF